MQVYLNTILFCLVPYFMIAQSDTIPIQTTISGNNMTATVNSDGSIFFDKETGEGSFIHKDFPDISFINSMDIWIGGYDTGGNLKTAIQRSGEGEISDFKPGLIEPETQETIDFNYLAKVTGEDIYYHLQDYRDNDSIDNPIESIFSWPGRGNPFFEEFTGMELPEVGTSGLAHFWDENEDGIYNPIDGDYPQARIRGTSDSFYPNEIIWTTAHDNRLLNPPNDLPVRVNIQPTVFSYNCLQDKIINNTIFVRYLISNRSFDDIDSAFFGVNLDASLGCPENDYLGVVPENNTVFIYNSDTLDADCLPHKGLRDNPGMLVMTLLRGPLDEFRNEIPLSFVLPTNFIDSESGTGIPTEKYQYYNYLSGSWKDGTPLTWGGKGKGKGGNEKTDFIFPDHPNDSLGWSERALLNPPGKRAFTASYGPFLLMPNAVNELVIALTYFKNPFLNERYDLNRLYGRGLSSSFDNLFGFPPFASCTQVLNIPSPPPSPPLPRMQIRQNPASEQFQVLFSKDDFPLTLWAYDSVGRLIFSTTHIEEKMIVPVSDWPAGVYFLEAIFDDERIREKIIVQHN